MMRVRRGVMMGETNRLDNLLTIVVIVYYVCAVVLLAETTNRVSVGTRIYYYGCRMCWKVASGVGKVGITCEQKYWESLGY